MKNINACRMLALEQLIQNLPPKDTEVMKKYLLLFTDENRHEATLPLKLFNYLLHKRKTATAADACLFIYGSGRNKQGKFRKLCWRLKQKIFDCLCTELNYEKKEMLDEMDWAAFRVRKKAAISRLLFFHNNASEIARQLIEEIISESKKFEFYETLAEHLDTKNWIYNFKEGEKEFDKIVSEAGFYRECHRANAKATNYYYKLIFVSEKNAGNEQKVKSFLKKAVRELALLAEKTKSNKIKYYLKYFELEINFRNKDYKAASQTCSEMLALIFNNPSVKRKHRIGITYDQFSRCELLLGNFEKAREYAAGAQKIFSPASFDFSISQEQEFYALFYGKKFAEAEKIASEMLRTPSHKELGELHKAKYIYLHAHALFVQGKFKEALNMLPEKWHDAKNNTEWETGLRIFRIMLCIELEMQEEAGKQTEALRKYFDYLEKKKIPLSPRNKAILAWLRQLATRDFDFRAFNFKHQTLKPEARWEFFTPEIIPFHEWAEHKKMRK
ncbi:MAG: hypothetical protein HY063_13490 [Bacteroidetes bacterium]|nr:hypothetical protein [Bacteroidota bacterium]